MSEEPKTLYLWIKANRPDRYKKMRASQIASAAARRGKIVKPAACERCGSTPAPKELHGHHHDYDKPLEVEWLCRTCHAELHKQAFRASEDARRARLKDPAHRLAV